MTSRIKNLKDYTILHHTGMILITLLLFMIPLSVLSINKPDRDEWVVVIDAGHGGKDPGSAGRHSKEKDIALAIALKTGSYIEEKIPGVKVIYTRKTDKFIELYKRAEIANKAKADLFISIHCNGFRDSRIKGSETFVMGIHKDEGNLKVAMKENSVITLEEDYTTRYQGYDPSSSESFIIFSLMQNIYLEQSLNFADYIQDQFRERVGRGDRGVKQAGLLVLWQTTMPSVLIEAGFITNSGEEKFLLSGKGQDYIASAIFRAFRDYKSAIDLKSDFTAIKQEQPLNRGQGAIVFMVQVVTSTNRHATDPDNFMGTGDITEIISGKYYKYATGHFKTYSNAADYRKSLNNKFPDAFVIAVKDAKIIPLQEAIEATKKYQK